MRSEQAAWEQQIDLVRGKVALAAGAAAGIGRAAALKFAEEGAKVAVGNLEELTRGCWKRAGALSLPSQNDAVDDPSMLSREARKATTCAGCVRSFLVELADWSRS